MKNECEVLYELFYISFHIHSEWMWSDIWNKYIHIHSIFHILLYTHSEWIISYHISVFTLGMWSDIRNISYFTSHSFLTGSLESTNDQLPTSVASYLSWLERRLSIARSRVQTPLKSWLFQTSIRNCIDCMHNCEDHSWLDCTSTVQCMKNFIHHFTF